MATYYKVIEIDLNSGTKTEKHIYGSSIKAQERAADLNKAKTDSRIHYIVDPPPRHSSSRHVDPMEKTGDLDL